MTRLVPISQVAEVNPATPVAVRNGDCDRLVPFLPMSAVSEDGRASYEEQRAVAKLLKGYTYFERGDVLVAKITPCFENGKAAFLEDLPDANGFGSTEFHVLRPGPDLDGRYLFHAVRTRAFQAAGAASLTGSAGQKRVPASFFERYRISLPPLAEQRRITAILDRAEAVQRKRQDSLQLLDGFQRSAFASLAGRANKNYQRWPQVTIASLANGPGAMRTGPFGSALRHSEFVDSGVAVLGIDNAVQNRFAWSERRFITHEKFERFKRYTVKPGDVLITIMGTTGRSSVVPYDIPLAISTKHLAVITVDRSRVHPLFLSHAIHSDSTVLAQIAAANRGAIMSGLNLGAIKRLNLRLPPLADQEQFAAVVNRVGEAQERFASAVREMDRLFESLAQRAFSGGG